MRDELQRAALLHHREVPGEGLPAGSGRHTARMLEGTTTRTIMKAQLEQPGALQTGEGIRNVDPDPLADDLREPPLAADTRPDTGEDLGLRQGPMLPMDRATELAGQPDGLNP